MTQIQTKRPNCIALHVGHQGAHSAELGSSSSTLEKVATEPKPKSKLKSNLIRDKNTFNFAIFNVRTLNTVIQLSNLTASATDKNIGIICVQEHR